MGESFGSRLRVARVRLGLTQNDLARVLDVREADVRRWEKGTNHPTPAKLAPLAIAADVSLDWLFDLPWGKEPPMTAEQRKRVERDAERWGRGD